MMENSIKINKLEIENVKRIKAVKIEPTKNGLTIVGGNNNQGKTSVLDSIAWALGGDRYKPSNATREGSAICLYADLMVAYQWHLGSAVKTTAQAVGKTGSALLAVTIPDLPRMFMWHPL